MYNIPEMLITAQAVEMHRCILYTIVSLTDYRTPMSLQNVNRHKGVFTNAQCYAM